MGFIRKSDAEEMLTRYATGTFLLRFSDSELGGLTVAWAGCKFYMSLDVMKISSYLNIFLFVFQPMIPMLIVYILSQLKIYQFET